MDFRRSGGKGPSLDHGRGYNRRMNALESIPFDTCRFVKRMTGAGMPLGQAEELADALAGEHKDCSRTISLRGETSKNSSTASPW